MPLVQADFWAPPLPFADAAFDAVVALHGTLAHPPDEGAMGRLARELARVARPGAVFAAEVPAPSWLDCLDATGATDAQADRRARRTGPRTCVYEDLVTGASIEARLLDEAEWSAALAPDWRATFESIDELEWLVVARRI